MLVLLQTLRYLTGSGQVVLKEQFTQRKNIGDYGLPPGVKPETCPVAAKLKLLA